jgi:hypothetical protein
MSWLQNMMKYYESGSKVEFRTIKASIISFQLNSFSLLSHFFIFIRCFFQDHNYDLLIYKSNFFYEEMIFIWKNFVLLQKSSLHLKQLTFSLIIAFKMEFDFLHMSFIID